MLARFSSKHTPCFRYSSTIRFEKCHTELKIHMLKVAFSYTVIAVISSGSIGEVQSTLALTADSIIPTQTVTSHLLSFSGLWLL